MKSSFPLLAEISKVVVADMWWGYVRTGCSSLCTERRQMPGPLKLKLTAVLDVRKSDVPNLLQLFN